MTGASAKILVVEDDPSILLGLKMNLENQGYEVVTAEDGDVGLRAARSERFDMIILDVMLPKLNGYELLCALRADSDKTPVLMLSARGSEVDKIMGLDVGADDYVTKPFAVGELLARVRAGLRRHGQRPPDKPTAPPESTWVHGDITVSPTTREVRKAGDLVELTATEFEVLAVLHGANGRILSRRQIMDAVWGSNHHGTERTVDNFIAQLRAKLESDPSAPDHILTVRGVGYRLAS